MRFLFCLTIVLGTAALCHSATAEQAWKYSETVDELTQKNLKSLAVADETGKHFLVLQDSDGQMSMALITNGIGDAIFPDTVATQTVDVTIRGSKTKPVVIPFSTIPQNLTTAKTAMKPRPARALLSGEFVILGVNKTGKRYKFPTSGEGREGLQEALEKIAPLAESH